MARAVSRSRPTAAGTTSSPLSSGAQRARWIKAASLVVGLWASSAASPASRSITPSATQSTPQQAMGHWSQLP
ncbi:hypothetical protein [Streptomyces sp. NPDC096132]|uniref:hypothetical protein n=1 Tax=Streptomyces sp. NPDC096132 TaxID=3366075 RepID=UPI00382847AF